LIGFASRVKRRLRGERGFTMIELLVAMPIMLVVMGGLILMLTNVTHWSSETQSETSLQTEARAALNRMEAEIRGTFVGDGTNPIITATGSTITFDTPDTYSTTISGTAPNQTESSFHLLQVSYRISNGTLQRQFKSTTNTYPTAPPWTWGSLGAWSTEVGTVNSITNTTSVFSYYTAAGVQSSPQVPLTFPISDTSGIVAVGVKLTLSTGGSQPEHFTVNDTIAIRGTSD
jgi:prepilin-type N-terminal cleavage/methylation domain-containing protein